MCKFSWVVCVSMFKGGLAVMDQLAMVCYVLVYDFCLKCLTDIDECVSSPCNTNASCTNTPGSFVCICATGFSGDGQSCIGGYEL